MTNRVHNFWDRAVRHHAAYADQVLLFHLEDRSYQLHNCHGDASLATGERMVTVGRELLSGATPEDVVYLLAHQHELPEWVFYYAHVLPHCTTDDWLELGCMEVLSLVPVWSLPAESLFPLLHANRLKTQYKYGFGLRCLTTVP